MLRIRNISSMCARVFLSRIDVAILCRCLYWAAALLALSFSSCFSHINLIYLPTIFKQSQRRQLIVADKARKAKSEIWKVKNVKRKNSRIIEKLNILHTGKMPVLYTTTYILWVYLKWKARENWLCNALFKWFLIKLMGLE